MVEDSVSPAWIMTFLILHAPNYIAAKYTKQKSTELQGKFTVVDLNTILILDQGEKIRV